MSSKITHLPPGLAHGAPQAKTEPRTQGKGAGAARPARTGAGGKGRAAAQPPHGDDGLFHQDLSQGSSDGRGKDAGHEQPTGGNKALQGPTPPQRGRGAGVARGPGGVSLAQTRQASGPPSVDQGILGAQEAPSGAHGRRAEQLKWAQLLQSVPQERLAAGQAVLKQHEAALEAFASKVAQLRRGR